MMNTQQQLSGDEVDTFLLNMFASDSPVEEAEQEPEIYNNVQPVEVEPEHTCSYKKYYAQDDAWNSGRDFVIQDGNHKFYAFNTHKERQSAAATMASRGMSVHERVNGSKLARPVLDVDGDASLTDADIKIIEETFVAVLHEFELTYSASQEARHTDGPMVRNYMINESKKQQWDRDIHTRNIKDEFHAEAYETIADPRSEIASWGYNNPDRVSRHIVAQRVVTTGANVKLIAQRVKSLLPEGLIRDSMDPIGQDSSYGLRIPGCRKSDTVERRLEFIHATTTGDHVPTFWMQDDQCYSLLQLDMPEVKVAARVDVKLDDAVTIEWDNRVLAKFPHYVRAARDLNNLPCYDRKASAHCDSCERSHESEGAYTNVNEEGTYFLNCRRAGKGTKPLMIFSTSKFDWRTVPVPDEDSHDTIIDCADIVTSAQYNTDAFPITADVCDTYMRAPWRTGKTHYMVEKIRKLRDANPAARILIATCRRTLSSAIAASFSDALDYRTLKGEYNNEAAKQYPILVCQIESLKRISDDLRGFDLMVLDEIQADLSHVYQPGASKDTRNGLTIMGRLVSKAVEIYVCDAGLTDTHIKMLKLLRPGKRAQVLVNNFKTWHGTTVDILDGTASSELVQKRMYDFIAEQHEAKQSDQLWRGCVVPCHSRKLADGIAASIRAKYGDDAVKLYTGESDQTIKNVDFANVEYAWSNVLAVVYTGTVSVGVSANIAHLTNCFAFFTSNNSAVLQSCQMLFRARQIEHIDISYTGKVQFGYPQTADEIFEWATIAKNRSAIPDVFRADRMPAFVHAEQTHKDPVALKDVVSKSFEGLAWVSDQLDRYRSARWFCQRMVRTLTEAGCAVTYTHVSGGINNAAAQLEVPVAKLLEAKVDTDLGVEAAAISRDTLASKEYVAALAVWQESDGDVEQRELTAEEIQGNRAVHAVRAYADSGGVTFKQISDLSEESRAEWLSYHADKKNIHAYINHTLIVCDEDKRDTKSGPLSFGDVQVDTKSQREACGIVRQAFAVLDITPTLLENKVAVIRKGDLATAAPSEDMVALLTGINKHACRVFGDGNGSRRVKSLAKGYNAKRVIGTLNVALKYVGAKIVGTYRTERDRVQQRNVESYTIEWLRNNDDAPAPHPAPHPARYEE